MTTLVVLRTMSKSSSELKRWKTKTISVFKNYTLNSSVRQFMCSHIVQSYEQKCCCILCEVSDVNTEILLTSRKGKCVYRVGCSFFSVYTNSALWKSGNWTTAIRTRGKYRHRDGTQTSFTRFVNISHCCESSCGGRKSGWQHLHWLWWGFRRTYRNPFFLFVWRVP